MARSVSTTPGWGKPETASELIKQYVDWIKAQPTQGLGGGTPASIGFVLTQSNPASFGAQMATDAPEVIYSLGNLYYSGGVSLAGHGTRQSSKNGFVAQTSTIYVTVEGNGVLTASGAAAMTLTLHHDVLVGSTLMPVESTSPGSVAALMLWAIPASPIH